MINLKSIFEKGKKQDIAAVLADKDKRVAMQNAIFEKYPDQVLIDIKMNIPGPIKNNTYIKQLFDFGIDRFTKDFNTKKYNLNLVASWNEDAGAENFYIVDEDVKNIKLACIEFEDQTELGRLFDADVLMKNKKMAISRKDLNLPVRKCFICSRPAKECARSRKHSVDELQTYISSIYWKNFA